MNGITASSSILLLICRETYAVLCLLPQNIHDPKQKKKLLALVQLGASFLPVYAAKG
jgi:hypothetical protein